MRKIIHVDMDAFFAAVEQRDDPGLRGRPIAVGGAGGRGVVMTASYEARVFGVRSAMPSVTAKRLCPDLVFVPARMDVYRNVGREVRSILAAHADHLEPLSIDEAYLDVTRRASTGGAVAIARAIKDEIRSRTALTASAGVSVNKFLAKIASDMDKPDGLTVIRPDEVDVFTARLPVERLPGVGPVTAAKLRQAGLVVGADLRRAGFDRLVHHYGRLGAHLFHVAHGRDERAVRGDRLRKSVGAERTFGQDLVGRVALETALLPIADKLAGRIAEAGVRPLGVTLKVKDDRFRVQTRARLLVAPALRAEDLHELGRGLLDDADLRRPVRLLGLQATRFQSTTGQLDLFGDQGHA